MKKITLVLLSIAFLAGCSTKSYSLAEIEQRLDKTGLVAREEKPYYQMIGAYNGQKYSTNQDYTLEIYVYKDMGVLNSNSDNPTADTQVYVKDNVLFILHTADKEKLNSLINDLNN